MPGPCATRARLQDVAGGVPLTQGRKRRGRGRRQSPRGHDAGPAGGNGKERSRAHRSAHQALARSNGRQIGIGAGRGGGAKPRGRQISVPSIDRDLIKNARLQLRLVMRSQHQPRSVRRRDAQLLGQPGTVLAQAINENGRSGSHEPYVCAMHT